MEKITAKNKSRLVYLGTPIGNIEDITLRQKNALEQGEYFAVEDTRTFKQLLSNLNISYQNKHIVSWHDQSTVGQVEWVAQQLKAGHDVYVASEAGSPAVSDPGHDLMVQLRSLIGETFILDTFPGCSSVMVALELCEFPPFPFHFHGFFPRSLNDKDQLSKKISTSPGLHLFFESPHRILETRIWIEDNWQREKVVFLRELTKEFHSVYHLKHFSRDESLPNLDRGELVMAYYIDKNSQEDLEALSYLSKGEIREKITKYLVSKKDKKSLAQLFADMLGGTSKEWYQKLIENVIE